jgi:hypothetical protein
LSPCGFVNLPTRKRFCCADWSELDFDTLGVCVYHVNAHAPPPSERVDDVSQRLRSATRSPNYSTEIVRVHVNFKEFAALRFFG